MDDIERSRGDLGCVGNEPATTNDNETFDVRVNNWRQVARQGLTITIPKVITNLSSAVSIESLCPRTQRVGPRNSIDFAAEPPTHLAERKKRRAKTRRASDLRP